MCAHIPLAIIKTKTVLNENLLGNLRRHDLWVVAGGVRGMIGSILRPQTQRNQKQKDNSNDRDMG
jgi:hypothetical protein